MYLVDKAKRLTLEGQVPPVYEPTVPTTVAFFPCQAFSSDQFFLLSSSHQFSASFKPAYIINIIIIVSGRIRGILTYASMAWVPGSLDQLSFPASGQPAGVGV
jgi:hypothetical protein